MGRQRLALRGLGAGGYKVLRESEGRSWNLEVVRRQGELHRESGSGEGRGEAGNITYYARGRGGRELRT
jgi:hypothetical protein